MQQGVGVLSTCCDAVAHPAARFGVWDLGFGIWGLGFGINHRVEGLRFRFGDMIQGLGSGFALTKEFVGETSDWL